MDADKLNGLDGLVGEVDAEGPPTPEQVQEQQQAQTLENSAREWGLIVYTVGGALAMLAPELRQVYSEDACLRWGESMAPVAEKYGWNNPANVPEFGLALTTLGLAVPTYLIVKTKLEQLREARMLQQGTPRREAVQQPADVPGAVPTDHAGAVAAMAGVIHGG